MLALLVLVAAAFVHAFEEQPGGAGVRGASDTSRVLDDEEKYYDGDDGDYYDDDVVEDDDVGEFYY